MFGVICRRNWALRLSIVLNVCVLLYVCAHFGAVSGPWIEESGSGWGSSGPSPSQEMMYGTAPRPNGTATASAPAEPRSAAPLARQREPEQSGQGPEAVRFKVNETRSPPEAPDAERRANRTVS
jgi:hypothetical protein